MADYLPVEAQRFGGSPLAVVGAEPCDICATRPTEPHTVPVPTDLRTCEDCAARLLETERAGRYTSLAHAARLLFGLSMREWDYLTPGGRRFYIGSAAAARLRAERR